LEPPTRAAFDEDPSPEEICDCPICLGEEDDEDLPVGLEKDLAELMRQSGMPKEATPLFLEIIKKYADSEGYLPDLDEIAEQEPGLFAQLLEIAQSSGLGPFGRSKRRRRKRRR
jgi:hypothetical protein